MVKEDYGQAFAGEVAKRLAVFVYRLGEQPQVSQALTLQVSGDDRFRDLHPWILNHLDKDLTQPEMSQKSLTRELKHIDATKATVVATANPGCHLQLFNGAKPQKRTFQVRHPISLLAAAYRAEHT
jgi:hypothetical protein